MRKYDIYNQQTDELIGQVEATSVISAEIKASELFNMTSDNVYALTATV